MIKRAVACGLAVALCSAGGVQAKMLGVGVSAFGGFNIPVAQDDAESGTVFGLRAPVQLINALRLEPWVSWAQNGDYTLTTPISGSSTFDGGEITSFGVNALVGSPFTAPGFSIAFLGGIGSHQLEAEGLETDSRVGFNLGLDMGIGLGATPLTLSARAEGVVIPLDGGGSRKNAFLTGALTYRFGL